jgi:hypothetical protein
MHGKGGGARVMRYMEFLHLEIETKVTEFFRIKVARSERE